jgi:hypothetical protein
MPLGTFGPAVSGAAALGEELRTKLPLSLIRDLDKVSEQIRVEIIGPLLCAGSDEELAGTFERTLPKFAECYVRIFQVLQESLQEDALQFSDLTMRSFRESERLIRSSGPQWIGQPATLNALLGLSTVGGIAKAAIRLGQQGNLVGIGKDPSSREQWVKSLISYWMSYFAVHAALTLLANGDTTPRLDNVVTLANRSSRCALDAYHLSKVIGLLKPPVFHGPVDQGDDEDIVLANTGMESYLEMLRQDDQP